MNKKLHITLELESGQTKNLMTIAVDDVTYGVNENRTKSEDHRDYGDLKYVKAASHDAGSHLLAVNDN